ncbi:MAG: recombination-associated protein RdgC [Burkholderiales bacterium]|nr:recombination-associated protein RdgC [Burkholderiales bacterium]
MWFKNLRLCTLPKNWNISANELADALATQAFAACTSIEMTSTGWIPPCEGGGLVHTVGKQMLLTLCTEKKLLPTSVIKEYAKLRAAEIEEQQGYKPGRKQMKEIKEDVTDELLPRAFSIKSRVRVWIDPVNGWLAIDTSSATRAQEVTTYLIKALTDRFPGKMLQAQTPPRIAMTCWLSDDAAPGGFTIDDHIELSSSGDGKGKVKYVKLSADPADIQKHIAAGKHCTQLALTWNDKISFILTENLTIRRVAALDVLKESDVGYAADEAEKFDSDFTLMTGELHQLITDLVGALGGVMKEDAEKEAANDAANKSDGQVPALAAA